MCLSTENEGEGRRRHICDAVARIVVIRPAESRRLRGIDDRLDAGRIDVLDQDVRQGRSRIDLDRRAFGDDAAVAVERELRQLTKGVGRHDEAAADVHSQNEPGPDVGTTASGARSCAVATSSIQPSAGSGDERKEQSDRCDGTSTHEHGLLRSDPSRDAALTKAFQPSVPDHLAVGSGFGG